MSWRKMLFPVKSRMDEQRSMYEEIISKFPTRLVTARRQLIQEMDDDFNSRLLDVSTRLNQIQAQFRFHRFDFRLDKYGKPLFLACFGDSPQVTTDARYERRSLTTKVWALGPPLLPSLQGHLRIFMVLHADGSATIDDIQNSSDSVNRGYGTLAWAFTESILSECHYHSVTGLLASVDLGHRNRQVHFYEKLGFTITLDDTVGSIRKALIQTAT